MLCGHAIIRKEGGRKGTNKLQCDYKKAVAKYVQCVCAILGESV